MGAEGLPRFHPQTVIRDWGKGHAFHLSDALTGVCVFGATGSGKTTGPSRHLAYGYLGAGFGGLVLAAKKEEKSMWQKWAADCGRSDDLIIVDSTARWRFNFLEWEASRPDASAGITINIVSILDEIAGAIAKASGRAESDGGINKFWEDALHHLNTNLVELPVFAGVKISLPLLRDIVISAPTSLTQLDDLTWQETSVCNRILNDGDAATRKAPTDVRADFKQCEDYWRQEWPAMSDKTRSIIALTFSMLVRPLITRPLRNLFSADTNIKPEATFAGKIILIDLPVQDFRLAGRVANLVWKFCFQVAVLRRTPPVQGYLRPVFLWADEAHNFVSDFDAEFQAVARSAGGCTVYLTQNRESYRRVLGNNDAVDSLLGNLQAKFFCQNSGDTNEWASKLLGERYIDITSTNVGQSSAEKPHNTSGVTRSEQSRKYVEPSRFTTLKRGGEANNFQVQCIVYNGGHLFPTGAAGNEEKLPYRLLTFDQK